MVLLVVALVSVFVFALDFGLKEGIEELKYIASGEVREDDKATDGNVADEHDHDHDHEDETTNAADDKVTDSDAAKAE